MSIDKNTFIDIIEKAAPPELMEGWDNSGIQIYAGGTEVKRVLTCLDICEETITEAIDKECDFIVSHHPMFFSSLKKVDSRTAKGAQTVRLIEKGISVFAAHTTFDTVEGGNNDYIAELLGIEGAYAPEAEPVMRVARLNTPIKLGELCRLVSEKITGSDGISYSGDENALISTVGICTGSGASVMSVAAAEGCDVLITGDLRYHDYQEGEQMGLCLIDAGHYGTEIFFASNMAEKLRTLAGDEVEVIEAEMQKNSFKRFFHMV